MTSSGSASPSARRVARETRSRPWLSGSVLMLKGLSSPLEAAARVSSTEEAVKTVKKVVTNAHVARHNEGSGSSPDTRLTRSCRTADSSVSEMPSAKPTVARRSTIPVLNGSVVSLSVPLTGSLAVPPVCAPGSRIPVAKKVGGLASASMVLVKKASGCFGAEKSKKGEVPRTGWARGVPAAAGTLPALAERLGLKSRRPLKPAPTALKTSSSPAGSPKKKVSFVGEAAVGFQRHYYDGEKLSNADRACCSSLGDEEDAPCGKCRVDFPHTPAWSSWLEAQQKARLARG